MDVTCERCGTEYEFDETLVSDRGTTVKCTNCGHLFKVFRPDADGAKAWQVESGDGRVRTIGSLKELQRLIASGVLTPDDRISRGGDGWKPLGQIAELSTFFEAAATVVGDPDLAQREARQRTSTRPGPASTRDERPLSRTLDGAAAPPGPPPQRKPKSTIIGVGATSTSEPPPRADTTTRDAPPRASATRPESPDATRPDTARSRAITREPPSRVAPQQPLSSRPPPPPRPPRPEAPLPPRPAAPPPASMPVSDADVTAPHRPVSRAAARPLVSEPPPETVSEPPPRSESEPPRAGRPLYLDDREPVVPARAKSRSGLWVTLVVVLAAGVGVALGWPQIAPRLGLAHEEDPAAPHLAAGDAALAQDRVGSYDSAVQHYTQALAYDDHDPRALTGIARAHALWAQALAFDASDLEARADEDPARRGEANAIRREVQRHAETSLQRAEDAVRHGSGDADAEAALADALRLTGDLTRARSRLDRALTLRSDATAETLRVSALLAAAEANGDLSAARTKAGEAVAQDPAMTRARLLYARALLAARDVGQARREVEAVLERDPQHPAAVALRDAIDQGRPPAPPTVDVPDGGSAPDAGAAPAPASPTPPEAPPAAPADEHPVASAAPRRGAEPAPAGGAVPQGRDYSWYIRQGDDRLERGDAQGARGYYEAARGLRASGSEALTGLGYVDLESGDAGAAAAKFRQAAGQGYAEAYIGLGTAYRRTGRLQDALTAFERYLERLPSGPRASTARRQADEIRAQLGTASAPSAEPPSGGSNPEPASEPPSGAEPSNPPSDEPPSGGTAEPTPAPPDTALPPPRDVDQPPPQDVPAVESDPDFQ